MVAAVFLTMPDEYRAEFKLILEMAGDDSVSPTEFSEANRRFWEKLGIDESSL